MIDPIKRVLFSFFPEKCYEIIHKKVGSKLTIYLPAYQDVNEYMKENMMLAEDYEVKEI